MLYTLRSNVRTSVRCASAAFALALVLPAQSVLNPGFETYVNCPTTDGQLGEAAPWYSPNSQTPDLMHACSTLTPSVPVNFYGNQLAHSGDGYGSTIVYGQLPAEVREYCGGLLDAPLVAGHTYELTFWVSLADKSSWAIADIGAHFKVGPHSGSLSGPLAYTPQIENTMGVLTDSVGWTQITGTYVAAGGEDHIALGNFRDNASTTATPIPTGLMNWCVYYYDDITLTDMTPSGCASSEVIGWSDRPFPASVGYLDVQDVGRCTPAETRCTTWNPIRATTPWAGGTAYDPRYQTAWVSDGETLAEYSVAAANSCRPRCPPFRAVLSDPNAVVSGLTCSDARPRLFQLATRPGLLEMTTYDNSGRCPDRPRQCRRELPAGAVASGIAYDEVSDLLFISISVPQPLGGYMNLLSVAPAQRPCEVICQTRFFRCSSRIVTGLGYDACSRQLFATDGRLTQTIEVSDPRRCELRGGDCCEKQHSPIWRGLAALPCWESRSLGRSCLNRDCPSCPSMLAGTQGDPALGTTFSVTLGGAPSGGQAVLFVNAGPCGPGISLAPPYCGVLYPPLGTSIAMSPVPIVGSVACGGRAVRGLPLAVDPRYCGASYCVQWLVICPRGGYGLSNALEFTVIGG